MQRSFILSSFIFIFVIGGLILINGTLLALTIPLMLYLGFGLIYGPERVNLNLRHTVAHERVVLGTRIPVKLTVTNEGETIEELQLFDYIPPGLRVVEGDISLIGLFEKGDSAELTFTVDGERGLYEFRNAEIWAADSMSLMRRHQYLRMKDGVSLSVIPPLQRITAPLIRPRSTRTFAGYIPAHKGGSGIDFFGVREYQQGDSMRHINWKANARRPGTFFTNEFELERVADVGIILDGRMRSLGRADDTTLFDAAVPATAAIAGAFLTAGNRVSLLIYGQFINWTVPGYGKVQRERILYALARARVGDSQVFNKLQNLPVRLFPPKSQIVMVSPLLPDDLTLLHAMRSYGYSVLVISPDPITHELTLLDTDDGAVALGARLARVNRALLFRKLRQAGVRVVNWDVRQPLDKIIRTHLMRPGRW